MSGAEIRLRFEFRFAPQELGTIVVAKVMVRDITLWFDTVFLTAPQEDVVRVFWDNEQAVFGSKSRRASQQMKKAVRNMWKEPEQ